MCDPKTHPVNFEILKMPLDDNAFYGLSYKGIFPKTRLRIFYLRVFKALVLAQLEVVTKDNNSDAMSMFVLLIQKISHRATLVVS